MCLRQVYFTNSCQQILNQPFISFIHHIWGETVLFIIETSDRMRYFTIFQGKLHSVNIQDDQSWALSETVQKFSKSPIRPAGSRFYSASCKCGRVFEWTLIELRFNIIANLFYFFCYLIVLVKTMFNLIKRLIRATFLSTPASYGHEEGAPMSLVWILKRLVSVFINASRRCRKLNENSLSLSEF